MLTAYVPCERYAQLLAQLLAVLAAATCYQIYDYSMTLYYSHGLGSLIVQ
jgi:hypothetical protein